MCGRFVLTTPAQAIAEAFGVDPPAELAPRYNVAPGQRVAVVRAAGASGRRSLDLLRWGLVPSWAKEVPRAVTLINARSDTAATKPAFRAAFRQRRCLVPASGFYEWQALPGGGRKQPWLFTLRGAGPFAMAGLWERWRPPEGPAIESCTILTTEPNELVAPIHDRMPVILPEEAWADWLDPAVREPSRLQPLLVALPASRMTSRTVSTWVNDARHEDPGCIAPP
ncbi:SOS response-associated peptidase [bacterium]|nr:SOS response-associated peptidase [bacterium]